MKKLGFAFILLLLVALASMPLQSCSNSTSTKTVTVYDTVVQHLHDTTTLHAFDTVIIRAFDTLYQQHFWDPEQSGFNVNLLGITYADIKTGFAVGTTGALSITTDGGSSWVAQVRSTVADIYSASFVSKSIGMVAGSLGLVMGTMDGGATWTRLPIENTVDYRGIRMIGTNIAYAVGLNYLGIDNTQGFVYKTTDGGAHWNANNTPSAPGLYGIAFTDANTGWVSGFQGAIYHTADGGMNWTKQNSGVPATQQVAALSFSDALHGMAVGLDEIAGNNTPPAAGFISTTSDGGNTWITKSTSTPLTGVSMADANNATAVGFNGTVMETHDAGQTWTTKSVGTSRLISVYMNDPSDGASVGENGALYVLGAH